MSVSSEPSADAYALPLLGINAGFKRAPEHFIVDEVLGFTPGGGGEHLWLHVEKRNENTDQLARSLARWAGVKPMAVSYSGMKDRYAVTRQWFSIQVPGARQKAIDITTCPATVLAHAFHSRKLKRGTHKLNRFEILLTDVQGDRAAIDARLQWIAEHGVPNYFGAQRFGREGGNVAQAIAMFEGATRPAPHLRSILLSAARSQIFNAVLSARVADGSWLAPMAGDVCSLDGSGSVFAYDAADASIASRMLAGDVHLSGPLWGRSEAGANGSASADTAALEQAIARRFPVLAQGLDDVGMTMERRALRLMPRQLTAEWQGNDLLLKFCLTRGAFATTVLRELLGQEEQVT
jgi:tRNA pseudouridine13 synthase